MRQHYTAKGFTLIEILIAMTILGMLMAGLVAFSFSSLNTQAMTTGKILVSTDIRNFTQTFGKDARSANYMRFYEGIDNPILRPNTGDTGDFILFFYQDYAPASDSLFVSKVVGYFRILQNTDTGTGPTYRFEEVGEWETVDDYQLPDWSNGQISSNNPDATRISSKLVVELTRGLVDGNLFYNYAQRRAVVVRGEIRNRGRIGQNAVNTYNFTVFPRG